MVGVHLAAALVRITLLVTTVMTRIVMRMMMRWRRRIINNMSLSPLDLFHNSLAQMAGVHLAAALVRITTLVTTVMMLRRMVVMMIMMMMMMTMMINSMSSWTFVTTIWHRWPTST